MHSDAKDVTSYLAAVPEERRASLATLRQLCQEILTDYEETMEYGMPSYKKNGRIDVAFASQKNYIALYMLKEPVVTAHRADLQGLSVGKGCIRYTKPEKLDFTVIRQLLLDTRESQTTAC